ncbi:hypothetical protein SLEP1_g42547 [Rubroshorea leprosula]|uniref:RNA polymerase II-associated protein 3 n=1 Tax=Rubroshorea leprosula TaxID=152421 RepID=A0AAV5LA67_9ROSI|nr:hypothetical protein SLEP1_g42547 [Rubroshorea leprosula]
MGSKHHRDQALDFQGFLNDLQDWELSLKDKDKKMKPQAFEKEKLKGSSSGKKSASDYLKNYDAISSLSSGFMTEESIPDAASEKELGNEYFKQKKFKEAIDCYSRSIALSPSAVAYANRGMAYVKLKKFQEAEDDCTEALNLDDRYIKAYSRRSTARKELGKLKESIEDAEFALRLEPNNQEIKKQHAEVKSLYEKEILEKASGVLRSTMQGAKKVEKSETKVNGHASGVAVVQGDQAKKNSNKVSVPVEEIKEKNSQVGSRIKGQEVDGSHLTAGGVGSETVKTSKNNRKQELQSSVEELASRAAARAMAEAAKNITPPNTAYQFEVSWRALSGDCALQAHLLKVWKFNMLFIALFLTDPY